MLKNIRYKKNFVPFDTESALLTVLHSAFVSRELRDVKMNTGLEVH